MNEKPEKSPDPRGVVDAVDLWTAESPQQQGGSLSVIKLDASETLIVPFTTSMVRQAVHYLGSTELGGYVQCLGQGCLLCRLGFEAAQRDLIPVFLPVSRGIGVLALTPNRRPGSLRAQMGPVLAQVKGGMRLLLGIRKLDNTRFAVSAVPLSDDADDGAEHIATFTAQLTSGAIDLRSVYPRLEAAELATIHDIATRMALKGIKLA